MFFSFNGCIEAMIIKIHSEVNEAFGQYSSRQGDICEIRQMLSGQAPKRGHNVAQSVFEAAQCGVNNQRMLLLWLH